MIKAILAIFVTGMIGFGSNSTAFADVKIWVEPVESGRCNLNFIIEKHTGRAIISNKVSHDVFVVVSQETLIDTEGNKWDLREIFVSNANGKREYILCKLESIQKK